MMYKEAIIEGIGERLRVVSFSVIKKLLLGIIVYECSCARTQWKEYSK